MLIKVYFLMNPSDRLVSVTEAQCSNTRSSIQGCSGGFSSPNENKWSVLHLGLSNESQQPSSSRRAEPQKINWLKHGALNSPRTVTDIPLYILDTVSHEELKQSTRYFFNVRQDFHSLWFQTSRPRRSLLLFMFEIVLNCSTFHSSC